MSNTNINAIPKAPDPFCDAVLGEWKPDKKNTDKDVLAFSRTAELDLAERHSQPWIDPVTLQKKRVYGKVVLTEVKFINKTTSDITLSRSMEPCLKGGVVGPFIQ